MGNDTDIDILLFTMTITLTRYPCRQPKLTPSTNFLLDIHLIAQGRVLGIDQAALDLLRGREVAVLLAQVNRQHAPLLHPLRV